MKRDRNTHKDVARKFEPEAALIRAEAVRQLTEIHNPKPKATTMPKITDPTSLLLARRIRALRADRGWTLAELAVNVEIMNVQTLSRIERGERAVTIPELVELAGAFGIVPEYLMRKGALCEACGQELPE